MFDAHCHLQDAAFDADRDEMIAQSRAAGVSHFLVPATDFVSFGATTALANSDDNIFCALGIHPHSAGEWNAEIRELIENSAKSNPKIVAVGEIGLDYHYDFSPREVQRKAFTEQIDMAIKLWKPIVIHTRESENDVIQIVRERYSNLPLDAPRGQFHCFSADAGFLQKVINLGFYVSFTGNITFKNSALSEVVRQTPLDMLLIETDSPYLAPVPLRGKRNSPASLPLIAQKIAEIKELDISIIMQKTFENAVKLFGTAGKMPSRLNGYARLILLAIALLACSGAPALFAQHVEPPGSLPPDSVLSGDRRKAEEIRKKQEDELAKEAAQHRQDSLNAAQKEQEDAESRAREQVRDDSIKAAEKLAEEQRQALFMETPQPWRAVGLGFSGGIGSMQVNFGEPNLFPTAVFAYGINLATEVTRRLDVELTFSHFNIGGDFSADSVYNYAFGSDNPTQPTFPYRPLDTTKNEYVPNGQTHLIQNEILGTTSFGIDLHYVITRPSSAVKFYFGIGYEYLSFKSVQQYLTMTAPTQASSSVSTFEQDWSRSGLRLLFGMKHDFELGAGYTIEPFVQIGATGLFNGNQQYTSFVFIPGQPIITVNVDAGFTLYYGWWGTKREQ